MLVSAISARFSRQQSSFTARTSLLLLDHPDDLRLGETAFPHLVCSLRVGRLYITARELPVGRSQRLRF
jgi:hypothetical protein